MEYNENILTTTIRGTVAVLPVRS